MAIPDPLIPALMTVPVLVGLQIALAPRYAVAGLCGTRVSASLCRALRLPWGVTDVTIRLPAGSPPTMTVTKYLTQEEVEAIAHWYETENLDRLPVGETLYSLAPRVQP